MAKKGKIFLATAALLAGTLALSACGEKAPDPTPEVHAHDYGEWEITAPTLEEQGSAKKVCSGCEAGTEGHEVTVTLPALTDEGYTKSGDTATCEEKGEATYTVTVDGTSFTFTGETAPKGHAYEEQAAVAPTCTTAGNKKYYTCENCEKVFDENKTECEEGDWELPASEHSYGEWEVTAPTESAAGSATKTCTKCADGADGHTVTVELPALTADNLAQYSVAHTKPATRQESGFDTYTYTKDGESVSFTKDVAFVTPSLQIGSNTIVITDNDSTVDVYLFDQTEEKKYDFTLTQADLDKIGPLVIILDGTEDEDGVPTDGDTVFDSADAHDKLTFTVTLKAGSHKLYFSAAKKGKFSLTIAENIATEDPDEGKLSPTNPVEVKISARGTKSIEIASTVEPGWYRLYPEGTGITEAALGRKRVRGYVNNVRIPGTKDLQAGRSKTSNVQDDFTIVAYLKPGDIVSYQELDGLGANLETIHMEAHEHGESGSWLVTKKPTDSVKGTAQLSCSASGLVEGFELPILTDERYTTESVEGGTKYTITIYGVTISFTVTA